MSINTSQIDRFTMQYIETALWSSTYGENSMPMDDTYDVQDFAQETIDKIKADCAKFQVENSAVIDQCHDTETCGHDFWLTRNGHGAGFWDGDYSDEIGDALTDASKGFGECDLYIGDDGLVYISP